MPVGAQYHSGTVIMLSSASQTVSTTVSSVNSGAHMPTR